MDGFLLLFWWNIFSLKCAAFPVLIMISAQMSPNQRCPPWPTMYSSTHLSPPFFMFFFSLEHLLPCDLFNIYLLFLMSSAIVWAPWEHNFIFFTSLSPVPKTMSATVGTQNISWVREQTMVFLIISSWTCIMRPCLGWNIAGRMQIHIIGTKSWSWRYADACS